MHTSSSNFVIISFMVPDLCLIIEKWQMFGFPALTLVSLGQFF
jgi:hypothetical protein